MQPIIVTALIGVVISAAIASPSASSRSPQAKGGPGARPDGRALFVTHCASCHGSGGRGDGPVAGSLRQSPGDLTQFARRNGGTFPSAKVHRIIEGRDVGAHGSVEMPVWGDVFRRTPAETTGASAGERIEAIVRYLESIQERTGQDHAVGH